jgi:hypothetical protein
MGFAAVVAVLGLAFSIISIRLMSIAENAQITMVGTIGKRRRLLKRNDRIVAVAIGARKFLAIKIGIVFFGRVSSLIFAVEDMYPERIVEGATMAMMNTVTVSNKLGKAVKRRSRHAAEKIMTKYNDRRRTKRAGKAERHEIDKSARAEI